MFGRLKTTLGGNSNMDAENLGGNSLNGVANDIQDATSLSWELRVTYFALCFALSMICSFLGSPLLFTGKFTGFGIMVSLGAVLSLISTCFLSGPKKQLRKMFEPTRLIATVVYLVFIILTFVAGFVFKSGPLALICIVGQYIAMAWYSISYIPYARETVIRICGNCF
uniref:Vesicle transport protein n=1 Tax=Panagrolaimus sp. JU765 TaxID=591449 RepID=A0AC34RPT8_9BILA